MSACDGPERAGCGRTSEGEPAGSRGGLLLYLLLEPSGEKVAVDLPVDATVAELKAAAHQAGGPAPRLQLLAVGTEELRVSGGTALSDTGLVTSEAVVAVRRQRMEPPISYCSGHLVALLEGGAVVDYVDDGPPEGTVTVEAGATCVASGFDFGAAVVAGTVRVWGDDADVFDEDLSRLPADVVSCATGGSPALLAVVDSCGFLHLCGQRKRFREVPGHLQGRVVAASPYGRNVVAMTREGEVHHFGATALGQADLGGARAVQISAGASHYAVLLEDGAVRCFGDNTRGQRDVPSSVRDAVCCSCGGSSSAALLADGTVRWWGDECSGLSDGIIGTTGPCVAVAVSWGYAVAVTAAGDVVADWSVPAAAHLTGPLGSSPDDIERCIAQRRGALLRGRKIAAP